MTERHLDDYVTPLTPALVYAALSAASAGSLEHRSLVLLCAHVGFETGWKAAHGNNLGNFKHVPGDGHDYITFLTTEYLHGQKVELPQDFRAYATLADGAADYLAGLRSTFGFAWPAVEAGDVEDFAHRLKSRGYYTAPEQEYARGMARVMADVERAVPPMSTPTTPDTPQAIADLQPLFVPPDVEPPEVDPGDENA